MSERRETAVAFVVARLTSSRLPMKQLRPIGDQSILERIMESLAGATELDRVVLATVDEPGNRPLRELAERRDWALFWYPGEVDDVVGRLRQSADRYAADICLLVSADCPLVHGPSVDALVRQLRARPEADYITTPPDADGRACLLEGVQVARRRAWQRADAMSRRPEEREHQFPVISRNPEQFRRVEGRLDASIYGVRHRLSVDTWADLEFMQTLYAHLVAQGRPFVLPEAVRLLDRQPELRRINAHVHQRRLIESIHRVLFVVDAGGAFGYGHFMRCRELAGQIVERLSWPVSFLLDDAGAAEMAEACGFRVLWGALGRPARPAAGRYAVVDPAAAVSGQGLVVVDVSIRREAETGWRQSLAPDIPVVVVDREDSMAAQADLILYPGITGRAGNERAGLPPVLEGFEYLILRREVQRYQGLNLHKDIDLLVYLYDEAHKQQVQDLAGERGWQIVILSGFNEAFPELLARSKVFLSGYGQSFYEAVALGAYPVAWPLSPAHAADALAFYDAAGMRPVVVSDAASLADDLGPLVAQSGEPLASLRDGTPAIVERLAGLCEAWR